MKIPDLLVGAVIGKGGSSLQDITNVGIDFLLIWFCPCMSVCSVGAGALIGQTSGAKIQISQKGDYYEGTRDRKVTLQGEATDTPIGTPTHCKDGMVVQAL